METELTKKIKRGLAHFRLDMPTAMRTPRYAEEVWTPTGIVDFIRFEDCKTNCKTKCKLIHYSEFDPVIIAAISQKFTRGECKIPGETCPNAACKNCVFRQDEYDVGMRITCFEVKITVEDFHSKHGHNFHGHHNYYVVPKDLTTKIQDEVPEGIGIIAYYEKSDSYRIVRECIPREVPVELQVKLLYDAMKKWVDKLHYEYWHSEELVYKTEYHSHTLGKPTQGETSLW